MADSKVKSTSALKPNPVASKPVPNTPRTSSKSPQQTKVATVVKKAVAKPATVKPNVTKPATSKASNVSKASPEKKDDKKVKIEKVKMERDSFTMPKDEYAQIANLKSRLNAMGHPVKKSELLRAGIKLLAAMSDTTLKSTMEKIPVIKTGRPKK